MAYVISLAKLFGRRKCRYIARVGNIISSEISNLGFKKFVILKFYQKVLNFSDVIIHNQKQ